MLWLVGECHGAFTSTHPFPATDQVIAKAFDEMASKLYLSNGEGNAEKATNALRWVLHSLGVDECHLPRTQLPSAIGTVRRRVPNRTNSSRVCNADRCSTCTHHPLGRRSCRPRRKTSTPTRRGPTPSRLVGGPCQLGRTRQHV